MMTRKGRNNLGLNAATAPEQSLCKVIAASRTSGTLNLSNRELKEVPAEVFSNIEAGQEVKWWEVNELTKLDLSHNQLVSVPQQLWTLTALNTLHLSFNNLQQLRPGCCALSSLKVLDVADNPDLQQLPDDIAQLPALASLNCSNCGLQQLPAALGLQQLHLSAVLAARNQLTELPAGLQSAKALVVLKLADNQLTALPGDVDCWRSLTELDVSQNNLQELPEAVGRLAALHQLDVRQNKLSSLPTALPPSLVELKAGFNRITELPTSLGALFSLKVLDVRNNVIQELPEELCGLGLSLLDLTNNSLRRLPPALGLMTTLRSLPLSGNPLKLMRRELWAGPTSVLLQHLRDQIPKPDSSIRKGSMVGKEQPTAPGALGAAVAVAAAAAAADRRPGSELVLRGMGLSCCPPQMSEAAASLTKLDLSDNPLGRVDPAMIAGLQQLKVLCLNSCALTQWPLSEVPAGALTALHSLQVRGNPFQGGTLPAGGLLACPGLRLLDLSGVRGLQLPDSFFAAAALEELQASQCGLCELPLPVMACTSLTSLVVSGNGISALPLGVTQLTRLVELDLMNNNLSGLPPQMGLMSGHLRVLQLEGNCLRTIRRPVLEKGTAALLDWLRDRIPTA